MELPFFQSEPQDISALVRAVGANKTDDTLNRFMPGSAWTVLSEYLYEEEVARGYVLMAQGALDRTVYFIESGVLRVHYGTPSGELQIALVGPGTVIGEGAFFSQVARNATVQATQACTLWSLSPERFDKLSKKNPTVALQVSMALGAVLAMRMLDVTRRMSVT